MGFSHLVIIISTNTNIMFDTQTDKYTWMCSSLQNIGISEVISMLA